MTDLLPDVRTDMNALPETIGMIRLAAARERLVVSVASRFGKRDELAVRLKEAFELSLPGPGKLAARAGMTILSSALDQWFIEKTGQPADDFATDVKRAVGSSASVVEQSGGWVRFDVTASKPEDIFARLCPIDMARLAPDDVVRTQVHHIGCLVWREERSVAVMGPRSTAASLIHALREAARSVARRG